MIGREGGAAALLLAGAAGIAQAQTAESVLAAAESRYASITTMQAPFVQTIINPMLGGPVQTRGSLYIQKPGHFAMRFSDPEGDRIVVDGEWMWAYAPSSVEGQVIRQHIPETGGLTPNLIAQFVERALRSNVRARWDRFRHRRNSPTGAGLHLPESGICRSLSAVPHSKAFKHYELASPQLVNASENRGSH